MARIGVARCLEASCIYTPRYVNSCYHRTEFSRDTSSKRRLRPGWQLGKYESNYVTKYIAACKTYPGSYWITRKPLVSATPSIGNITAFISADGPSSPCSPQKDILQERQFVSQDDTTRQMARNLVWIEGIHFKGFGCSGCAWVFNPSDPTGNSFDEMMRNFELQRDREYSSHVCADHPRNTSGLPSQKVQKLG